MAEPAEGRAVATISQPPSSLGGSSSIPFDSESIISTAHDASLASRETLATLHADEALRSTSFALTVLALVLLAAPWFPFLGGEPPWLRQLSWLALAAFATASFWVFLRARDPRRYTAAMYRVFGCTCAVSALVLCVYFGVFAATPIILTYGLAFFALSGDGRWAVTVATLTILAWLAVAVPIAIHAMPDPGLIPIGDAPPMVRAWMLFMVPAIMGITVYQGRKSRRASLAAIEATTRALRLARDREAQLEEANLHLEEALGAGVGRRGRYSGREAGSWKLEEVIGRGAMGEIYAASGEGDQRAAVKLLTQAARNRPDIVERFEREAEIAGKLSVPNVVTLYELGSMEDSSPFIAMELLSGHDLDWHLRRRGRLPLKEVVELVTQITAGLTAAHEAGIVHRDLKPRNLFLAEGEGSPVWKVLDFGVSKLGGTSGTLTRNRMVGTPAYMSPEQASGRTATVQSDVFSLGLVTYRALTGRPAFGGRDVPRILFDVTYRNPPRPSDSAALPLDVDLALALALAKDPERRLESAEELCMALTTASREELEVGLRRRARRMLHRHPWGARRHLDEAEEAEDEVPEDEDRVDDEEDDTTISD